FGVRVKGGEEVHAAVVVDAAALPAGAEPRATINAALERIADTLPSYQRLQHVELLPELPKTTTLKVRRHEVARLAAAQRACSTPPARPRAHDKVEAQIFELVRKVSHGREVPIAPASTLQFDLGLDSLDRVELLAALEERFGLHLSDGIGERVHRVQ